MKKRYWALRTSRNTIKCFPTHEAMTDCSRNMQWNEKGDIKLIVCNPIEPDRTLRQLIVNMDEVYIANPALNNHLYLKDTLIKITENSWELPTYEENIDWESYEKLVLEIANTLLDAGIASVSFYPINI